MLADVLGRKARQGTAASDRYLPESPHGTDGSSHGTAIIRPF
jgi:hypothetical protein